MTWQPNSELRSCGIQSGGDQFYDTSYEQNSPLNQIFFDIHSYIINFFMFTVSKHNFFVDSTQARPVKTQDSLRVKSQSQLYILRCTVRCNVPLRRHS